MPVGQYPLNLKDGVVPGSDGAGSVVAVGRQVTRFKPGDKVVTLFNQANIGGPLKIESRKYALGGEIDGTLRTTAAFNEQGLVHLPSCLDAIEGASLTCAGLTAWNALNGLPSKQLLPGQWVLTQGTGGVSIFTLQFAKAVGAKVISTTSSAEKANRLKELGADHVLDYKKTPNWGEKAKELTGGEGVHHIVEVAGPTSMEQSLKAIRIEGVISIIGFVGGATAEQPGFLECLMHQCIVRGLSVGNRYQMEDMCAAIEANPEKLKPVIDSKVFTFEQTREAYKYQWSGQHFGKVGIKIE